MTGPDPPATTAGGTMVATTNPVPLVSRLVPKPLWPGLGILGGALVLFGADLQQVGHRIDQTVSQNLAAAQSQNRTLIELEDKNRLLARRLAILLTQERLLESNLVLENRQLVQERQKIAIIQNEIAQVRAKTGTGQSITVSSPNRSSSPATSSSLPSIPSVPSIPPVHSTTGASGVP